MSFDTSILEVGPSDCPDTTVTFVVDGKEILAHVVPSRHPEMKIPPHVWDTINGAELWGFFRRNPVDRVFINSHGRYVRLVIDIADDEGSAQFFKVENRQFREFADIYCNTTSHKLDWRQVGF